MAEPGRIIPTPTPETKHYWDGAREGELRIQACNSCEQNYFPPRAFCPKCGSRDVKVVKASGKGRLYSYIINHLPSPGYTPPFTVAIVELEEGVRLMTNLLEVEPGEAWYVGDSRWDMVASKAAGMRAIAVLTGATTEAELKESGADIIYPTLREFMEAIPAD